MRHIRVGFSIVLMALSVGATVSAQSGEGELAPPGAGGAPVNSITIVTINTGTKGSVNIAGTFTKKDATTTLDSIDGFAYPTNGGIVSKGGGDQAPGAKVVINNATKAWTSVIVASPALTKESYQFRVVGNFSGGGKAGSQFFAGTPDGAAPNILNPAFKITWKTGFPKSTVAKTISAEGDYSGAPNVQVANFVFATVQTGGAIQPTGNNALTAITPTSGTWKGADFVVDPGGVPYSVIALINATDGNLWCSTIGNATPGP